MIDKNNFKDILKKIGFSEIGNVLYKEFPEIEAILKVDFKEKKIIYPTDKGFTLSGEFTTSFAQKESFVVFECVHRLFEKGYKPQHIELEPKWTVGHGASGGRADIMIKDNTGKSLLIIECKTAGKEFHEEWKNTLINGGQVFSYAKQAGSTQFVAIYTSELTDNEVRANYYLITLKDNEKLLEELADKEPLSYKKAKLLDKEDIYRAWKETYSQDYSTKGIFEDDIPPYEIGKTKYSLADLSTINSNDIQGKYHQFATILRQHNVSGRENAFDKLVNLFLCKIVDETNNPDGLKFYWKGIAYDSFFELQDRLQKLYQEGMKRFLGEDVTYIDNEAIDHAFRYFKNDPDATREVIKKYFRELKFFTNSDFAFIDVHNEKLFYQNSAVLLKIVQMLQDIQLKTEEENQFLGDMFEGFLDQGIKQSEGQFFTPLPIVKFILKSLPLEHIIAEADQIPRVIDYACGAGHFLNEYAQEIESILEAHNQEEVKKYFEKVVGIEKEYRLSKVAKVSAFMYGQDDIDIVYADALANIPNIKDNQYSILVSNPPYSVKGFLETLSSSDRKNYQLIEAIDEKSYPNSNSIEAFFIERAKQLLKPGGVAGIIMPASILTKGKALSTSQSTNVYVATREVLLKYFDIVAIVEFGSGTFGKTGTNTVTLFVKRKKEDPAPADHYQNRVNDWFKGIKAKNEVFKDEHFVKKYCDHLNFNFEDYQTLLEGNPNEALLETNIFQEYSKEFDKWADIKRLKKSRAFKKLPKENQKEELEKRFFSYLQATEKDKLYYFILASLNPQKVLIVKSPSQNKELKKFLGYDWSSAKGKEGIKYLGGVAIDEMVEAEDIEEGNVSLDEEDKRVLSNIFNLNNISTPLYDPKEKNNPEKINHIIAHNFIGQSVDIPEELESIVSSALLTDMIDLSRPDFNKSISLSSKKNVKIKSKWNLARLGSIAEIKNGGTPDTRNPSYWDKGTICWATLVDTKAKYLYDTQKKITELGLKNSSAVILPINSVIFSSRATIGEVCINKVPVATNQGYKNFICNPRKLKHEYLYYILNYYKEMIESIIPSGTKYKEISGTDIKNFEIPLPNLKVQEQIASACQKIDNEFEKAKEIIEGQKIIIENLILELTTEGHPLEKVSELAEVNPSKTEVNDMDENTTVSFIEMASVSEAGYISHKEDRLLKDVKKGSYRYFKEGDIIVAKITPCMENGKCAIANGLTNSIGFGSSEFHVFRPNEKLISNKYLFAFLNRESVRQEAAKKMTGSSGHRRVPETFYKDLQIPVPVKKNVQSKLIKNIEQSEAKIKKAQELIHGIAKRKNEVIKKHL
ncbi:MAG: restriction endonuclease subunit S [Bacteriovoracia bacterium]